jgi:hypothetical protein
MQARIAEAGDDERRRIVARRTSRQIGRTTCSTWACLSTPGGPSASVTHSIAGPPAMRQGCSAASIAAVTAPVQFGLITTIRSAIAMLAPIVLSACLPAFGPARNRAHRMACDRAVICGQAVWMLRLSLPQ